jgi:5-methylcytosine-specific restriction protein A
MPNRITACGCCVPKGTKCVHEQTRATDRQRANDAARGSAASRGYDGKWARESRAYLAAHPTCVACGAPARCVDHIRAHKGDMKLFWDRSNWQPMCIPCNSRKNIKFEGGFGR